MFILLAIMTPHPIFTRRVTRALPLLPLLLCACLGADPSSQAEPPQVHQGGLELAPGEVIVSLSFDDGLDEHAEVAEVLEAHGMRGTFYVISGRLGMAGQLTYDQLQSLQARGHEIGCHTISHPHLTTLDPDSQRREVCDGRVALLDAGLRITSLSYPFGDQDETTRQIVIDCNYNSARASGGLSLPGDCTSCPKAEPVPPSDPYAIRTHGSVKTDWALEDLQALVLQAEESGGGWVPIVFHRVCEPCDSSLKFAISWSTFEAFLGWLETRASRGTTVRTMDQVIGGTLQPPVSGTPVDGGTPDPSQLLE